MTVKKKLLTFLLILLILGSSIAGLWWHDQHYARIDYRFYPKNARELDLRGEEISISHYQKLRQKLPDCRILWDVPIGDGRSFCGTQTLVLPRMTGQDAEALACFPQLKTLDATGCEDYALLQKVRQTYPQLEVLYTISIGDRAYSWDTTELYVDGFREEEAALLQYMPKLQRVYMKSGRDVAHLEVLIDQCRKLDIPVFVTLGGSDCPLDAEILEIRGITGVELPLLGLMPNLKQATLSEPQADAENLIRLRRDLPKVNITWEKTLFGSTFPSDAVSLDLTAGISPAGALAYEKAKTVPVQGKRDTIVYQFPVSASTPLPDLTGETARLIHQVEQAMAYFPEAREVILGGALLDNEAMAAFREAHRSEYKVVWTVQCGNKMIARTDTPYFMPTKYHVYYFLDADAVNLKYCEEIRCLDLGHMAISHIDWVQYMPDLTYLVLAHTQLKYIEPIRSCRKLKFLELDWSPIRDYTPLKDCTALEDLNLGKTYGDFTPIGEMTWLKNLWMVDCGSGPAYRMTQALTNTKVMVSGSATVANGWRELPNYYAMRDALGMYYMKW